MPEQARILQFPSPAPKAKSVGDALALAQRYLSQSGEVGQPLEIDAVYRDLDVLLAICGLLRERAIVNPASVFDESSRIFSWLTVHGRGLGYFDERDFFLGEAALLAGSASRLLGNRSETELWLDRADASYRHTINPTASLARVAYVRLSLRYDMGRYTDVLELLPSIGLTFEKLGMHSELGKCRFLEAMSLKELGRYAESASRFQSMLTATEFQADAGIRGMAMTNLGNLRSLEGDAQGALVAYKAAQPMLEAARRHEMIADLKGMVAETLRTIGQTSASIDAYRECVSDHIQLGMEARAAYVRVLLSEALLEAGRPREAEWELLAALPTINEQQMVPEGFAAVVLLQESLRQRKTDPKALSDLRQYLQTAN